MFKQFIAARRTTLILLGFIVTLLVSTILSEHGRTLSTLSADVLIASRPKVSTKKSLLAHGIRPDTVEETLS